MLQKTKNKKILDLKKNCWIGTGGMASNAFFLEDEKDFYIRLAFSGIDKENLAEGMNKFKNWIESRRN